MSVSEHEIILCSAGVPPAVGQASCPSHRWWLRWGECHKSSRKDGLVRCEAQLRNETKLTTDT